MTRAWERLSNRRSFSFSTSAPASIRAAAALWVSAVVLLNRKQPVSVATPVYRQEAISGVIFAPMSFLVYFGLSFLIPSTSGMATVSMPIMGPLAVKLGFSPEVMVMIFSAAIGVVNLFTPTSGAIMGGLALAKIEWTTWLKFALKLIVALSVVCAVILTIACVMI